MLLHRILATKAPGPVVLVRVAVGAGRFAKIGLPDPEPLGAMAHESRTDWSMLLGSIFLLIVGAGPWSLDRLLASRSARRK